MARDVRLEKLTRIGIELMRRERELALKGDLKGLEALNEEKLSFLDTLEGLRDEMASGGPEPVLASRKRELATLFDIIKRRAAENQALLRAAELGVKSAARRLQEIFGEGGQTIGYTASGEKVEGKDKSTNTNEVL